MVLVSHYYLYISNDWFWLQVSGLSLSVILITIILLFPESPEYLMSNGETDRAIGSFKTIAKYNGSNSNFKF